MSNEKMMIEVHAISGVKEAPEKGYTNFLTSMIDDENFSWGAKHLIMTCIAQSVIQSKDCYVYDFSEFKLGRRKAHSFIKECIENGYAHRHKYTEGKTRKEKVFLSDSKEEIDLVKKNLQKDQKKSYEKHVCFVADNECEPQDGHIENLGTRSKNEY